MADFTAAEVEDGTGKSTAIVYENIATITASGSWLDLRGYSSLSGGTEATQKVAMLKATDKAAAAMQMYLRGVPVDRDQGLQWPLAGAYAKDGTLFDSDEVPEIFLQGWRLACEKQHAGTLVEPTGDDVATRSERVEGWSRTLSAGVGPGSGISLDPDVWPLLLRALPP